MPPKETDVLIVVAMAATAALFIVLIVTGAVW